MFKGASVSVISKKWDQCLIHLKHLYSYKISSPVALAGETSVLLFPLNLAQAWPLDAPTSARTCFVFLEWPC